MTIWQNRILETFLSHYPRSAAASGGRPVRLTIQSLFPDFDHAPPDERESFLEAAESLEEQRLVQIIWVKRRKGEALSALVCCQSEALFALAGKISPSITAEAARHIAAQDQESASGYQPLVRFIAEHITPEDAARGLDPQAVTDLITLIRTVETGVQGITPRSLSVSLYGDSKRLEQLLNLCQGILNRGARQGIRIPDFSSLARAFPETLIAGKATFFLSEGEPPLVNASGSIIGLPLGTILKIRRILPLGERDFSVLTIENKETFYALAETVSEFACLLYTGGHANRAVQALVGLLAASGASFYHAGDLDPEGVIILQELRETAGKPVVPLRMDGNTFDQYQSCARKLENSMLRRMDLITEKTRALPGIAELLHRIAQTGVGIDQEIIDYRKK